MWAVYIKKELPKKSLGKRGQLRLLHGPDMIKISSLPAHVINQYFIIDDLENFIPKFTHHNKDRFVKIIFSRGSAIGDLISLSSPVIKIMEAGYNVTLVTDKDGFPIVHWYEKVPVLRNYNQPFIDRFNFKSDEAKLYAQVDYLGTVEMGDRRNWFELYYDVMKWPFTPKDGRPRLRTTRLEGPRMINDDDLLINSRSTDTRRNIPLWVVYNALINVGAHKKYRLCLHEVTLVKEERAWIEEKKPDIYFIKDTSKPQALLNFFDAGMVVASDTGALHFREGVQKKAIGIYTAFSTESRTKYYLYTRSYDVNGNCDMQPCFEHGSKDGLHCKKNPDKMFHSPCTANIENELTKLFEGI